MSSRKRPRNNNAGSTTPSSAGRSSCGSTSSSSSSSAMRRTTSLSDLAPPPEIPGRPQTRAARGDAVAGAGAGPGTVWGAAEMMMRHPGDFLPAMKTAAFLKACGICKRHLGPGRDTFIYMGEVAFCSQECRQKQMNLDELMEKKCSAPAGSGGGGSSDQSGKSSTVAAA